MKNFKLIKLLALFVVLITSINTAWGWGSSNGTVVYFDKQNVPGLFSTPYLRVGRGDYNEYKIMTLVSGTKYLYSYSLGKWDNYAAISVANNYGWTGSNTIYQPKSDQFDNGDASKPKEGYKSYQITQQTNYYENNISGNFYIQPTDKANLDWACQYYNHNNGTLPTYSITYNSPSNGTLTVERYTGSTYTSLASGTTGLKPTQIIKITTSPNTHYGRASLTVTGATQIDGGDTYYITANCTINVTFDHKWTIKGGNSNTAGDGSDAMGDWSTYNNLSYTGTANTYRGTITLAANTTYRFKVVDRDNGTDAYYGYGGSDAYHLSFVGQSTASSALNTNSDNKENLALMSAGAGTYTFTWNSSSKTLTVDYPTVTHPSTDYIYYKDYDNYDSHGDIVTHVWGGSTASTGDQRMPVVNSFNFDGTTYFYAALGNNTKAIFAGSDNTATYKTEDLNSASSKKGKYYDKSSNSSESTRWQPFTATLTLDHQAATNTPAPNSITVTYGASTNLTGDIITTTPTKDGYNFGGYYTQEGGVGDQFIATNENVNTNVPNYTDGSKKWIKTGSSVSTTIYAKWTQEVTLNKHNDESNGSVTMTYNSGSHEAITTPEKTGYTFTGWYAAADGNALVIATDGTLQNSTSYTDASGKWTNSGEAPTLHAHWTAKTYDVTLNPDNGGATTYTISATYDAPMPSKLKDGETSVSAPSKSNYTFAGYYDGQYGAGTPYYTYDGSSMSSANNWDKDDADVTLYGKWTQTITLNRNGASTGSTGLTAVYGATLDLSSYTAPSIDGYDFGGYQTAGGVLLIDKNGDVQEVSGITNSSKEWENPTSALTLMAIWDPITYTINLNDNFPSGSTGQEEGAESFTADYNTNTYSFGEDLSSSLPSVTGYTFTGYYTADDPDVPVIKANGQINTEATSYVGGTGKWVYAGGVDLYAHWTVNTYTITLNDRGATGSGTDEVTATYDSKDLSSAISNPTKWGNTFAGWVANSNGTGTVIIGTDGKLVEEEVDGYIDEDGKWIRDNGNLTLYAKWTPKAASSIYLIDHSASPTAVSSLTTFNETGTAGVYYVTVDMETNDVYHFGDGVAAAGPAGASADRTFLTPLDIKDLDINSYGFKYTGTKKQTVVFRIDLNSYDDKVRLYVDHLVIYRNGDKGGDGHVAYGSVAGFNGTIYGEFEYRMSVHEDTWSSLYLPFSPSAVKVWDAEDGAYYPVLPYYRPDAKGPLYDGHYVIRKPSQATDLPLADFGKWTDPEDDNELPVENQPYIIQWHDFTGGHYFEGRYISFYGDDGVSIPSAMPKGTAPTTGGVVNFCGNTALVGGEAEGAYVLHNDYGEGAWLRGEKVTDKSSVGPFECFILADPETTSSHLVIKRRTGEETPTGWEDVMNSEPQQQVNVYTITGFKVAQYDNCSIKEASHRLSAERNEGIYILRAGNESVKLILGGK